MSEDEECDRRLQDYVGMKSERVTAWDPVERGAVRRFVQATGDVDPVYYDAAHAAETKYGQPVAPPLFVTHASRRPPQTRDPFELFADEPDLDGSDTAFGVAGAAVTHGAVLPPIEIPQQRRLNGGVEAEFYALPVHGDAISLVSEYVDVHERHGRSGLMVFVTTETTYENQDGQLLAVVRNTSIRR